MVQSLADESLELEEELALDRARRGLLGFTVYTKPNYFINWHHRIIARALKEVAEGKLKRLIICQPPRTGKSELVSTRFPAYLFGVQPNAQVIAASYNTKLANRMNRSVQKTMLSPEYARVFPGTRIGSDDAGIGHRKGVLRADEFEILGTEGSYRSTSIGGSATGFGMTVGIIDDPVKNRDEANSRVYQQRNWDWYTSTFYSRLEKDGAIIVTATRWSRGDLVGMLLDQAAADPEADQWTVLRFPSLAEADGHPEDPRQIDEALWPEKYPRKRLLTMKTVMGSRDWASLHQQRPSPEGGGVVQSEWWQTYTVLPHDLTDFTISVDLTFEDRGDYACYQVWAARGPADRYLVDMVMKRETFTQQCTTFEALCRKWPQARVKLVEKAANGAALISTLKTKIQGIVPVKVTGAKEGRAEAVAPQVEAGNVYLPSPKRAPWVSDFIQQWADFPNGLHDDAVDAASQALSRMRKVTVEMGRGMPKSLAKSTAEARAVIPYMPVAGRRRDL